MKLYLSLGSNLGDRAKNLQAAIARLAPEVNVIRVSPVYETEPKYKTGQPRFLNLACLAETKLSALDAFHVVKKIEKEMGRIQTERFSPRVIDIDVLFYESEKLASTDLTIPHPRLSERAFVLVPLCDIAPDFIHPLLHVTMRELLMKLGDTSLDARRTSEKISCSQ